MQTGRKTMAKANMNMKHYYHPSSRKERTYATKLHKRNSNAEKCVSMKQERLIAVHPRYLICCRIMNMNMNIYPHQLSS
jgi:hypothetical protein